jgi:hypothetical protein
MTDEEKLARSAVKAGSPVQPRKEVEEAARETAGLFQRSSSAVEGRNGIMGTAG